jgi:hypothetical protein
VVVDPEFERGQQRRLAVEAAADDQRHTSGHPEAGHRTGIGRLERHAQPFRRLERDGVAQRAVVDAAVTRQDRGIGGEGDEPLGGQRGAQGHLVLGRGAVALQRIEIQFAGLGRRPDHPRETLADQLARLMPLDAPPRRGQVHREPQFHPGRREQAGRALEHALRAGVDVQIAVARRGRREGPRQVIARGAPARGTGMHRIRQSGHGPGHERAQARGGGERVRLHVVDVQREPLEGVAALDVAVRLVAATIDAFERLL